MTNFLQNMAGISNYMVSKGYYHPEDLSEQLQVDIRTANTALNLSQQ
ncbi:hypothetical protein ACFWMS_20280 [Peribacillus butanolivorans]